MHHTLSVECLSSTYSYYFTFNFAVESSSTAFHHLNVFNNSTERGFH